jgi:tripartite-type tricarboxylate transporter receptor subunit TctC
MSRSSSSASSRASFSASRRHALGAVAAGLAGACAPAVFAQGGTAWQPAKPIRFLVGFSAGGSADTLARLVAGPMGQYLGTQVVVENIVGAGAGIAMSTLARSAPDGLVIGMGSPGSHAINPAIQGAKMPYKVPQDFTPITLLVTQPNVLIVNNALDVNNMAEFLAWVKAHPGAAFGSAGVGTSNQLCGELLSDRLGVKLTHVAYKGASQVITDLLGGHIPMTFDNITTAAVLVKEKKVKAIAVTTAKRSAQLPDVPTIAESGMPGYDLASWQGLFGPRGLPAPVLKALYDASVHALKDPEVTRRLADFGSDPGGQSPDAFGAYVQSEMKRWGDIVRIAKITAE